MIPELGQFSLLLAFCISLMQAAFPLYGAARGDAMLTASARPLAALQFVLILAAFAALTVSHAASDFSVLNVAENSHTAKPFIYKLTGVWGNHEGSMLLWVLILAGYGAVLALGRSRDAPLEARTLAIQGAIAAAFLAFVIFTSNPFERLLPAPPDGADLNPLLQDPGLAIHPPFLYLGYVGFSMSFAFAIAGLIGGDIDRDWARAMRAWALAAWVFLTIGIALGSWWAYYELGWGGFWAWDPVENASFMPWLAGTALIHSVRVLEKRDALKVWTVLLAISAFSLSLIGTFLVRSGILTSVHAFAVDPQRGVFILAILGLVIGGSLLLFALRAPLLTTTARFSAVSREGGVVINNILMSVSCLTVFVGTFYPLFVDIMKGERLSVGAPYFNATFLPLMALLLIVVAPMALLPWKRGSLVPAFRALWPAAFVGLFILVLSVYLMTPKFTVSAIGAGLAGWAGGGALIALWRRASVRADGVAGTLRNIGSLPRPFIGMSIAHFGFAVLALGALGVGVWRTDTVAYLNPGDHVAVGGYDIELMQVERTEGPNYIADRARFDIYKDDRKLRSLSAERRFYPVRGMQTTEASVWTRARGDLYLAVGEARDGFGLVVRAWYFPLTLWLWIGAGLLALGGVVAATPRRAPRGEPAAASAMATEAAE